MTKNHYPKEKKSSRPQQYPSLKESHRNGHSKPAKLPKNRIPLSSKENDLNGIIDRFPKAKILVIGDCILDEFVRGTVDRISPEAPVPVVKVKEEDSTFVPGGSLNVAHNIRTLGGTVYPCGLIGRDLWGRMLLKKMRQQGVPTEGMIYDTNRRTILKTRVIAHSQQVVRFDREDSHDIESPQVKQVIKFVESILPKMDVVVIEDYGKGMIVPELLGPVLKQAKALGKPILVDPKEKHFSYYKGATVITPNRKEAVWAYEVLQNDKSKSEMVKIGTTLLEKLDLESVLITLGEEGMMLFERNGLVSKIQTVAQEVFDVSGAGDTVIATLALALASKATMQEAAELSNFAAGIVVGKLGTATLTAEELKERVSIHAAS